MLHVKAPQIVKQHQVGDNRVMTVKNPLKTTWVTLECENVISGYIRIPGHKTSTVVLRSNEAGVAISEPPCVIMNWVEQESAP